MEKKISLIQKFLIFCSLSFILIWIILSYAVTYEIQQYTAKRVKTEISDHVRNHAYDKFPETVFEKPDYVKNKALFEDLKKHLSYLGIERVKIYDRTAFVIFSDEASLIGKSFNNHDLDEALEGKEITEIKKPAKEENATEKELGTFIEAYIPIKYPNQNTVAGVVEVYYPLDKVNSTLNPFIRNIWATSGGVLGLLFLALYFFFKRASNTIIEKNRELADKTTELKLSKDQDEAILESVDEALLMINKGGQVLTFNPKAEDLTGYSNTDTAFRHYKSVLDFRDKDDKKLGIDFVKEALEKGTLARKSSRDNIFLKQKKGESIPISLICVPIYDHKIEKIVGTVITMNDASKDKELDRVKDEFVYVIAHELNNPIFAVNGYLSMLLDGNFGKLNAKQKNAVLQTQGASTQLSSLVTDLLEVIRSETGQMKFELEKVDLLDTVKEVVENLKLKAKDKNSTIKISEDKLPQVSSNYLKLKEIVTNLVDNAIKYSQEGSEILISFNNTDKTVITNVKDNGFGMSKKDASQLFQKFYRISTDKTKNVSGTGLGLFIVKQLVEKMGGEIWVDSEEGKGSTFSFELKVTK